MVLYRKYRPQKIAEIDSPAVREKLENILSSGRVPHAFLFTGPKGTGKTSSARLISKSVNCERNGGKGEPCNKCSACVSITNGTNLDVLEIDAASNRGIDEIRELRDKIRLAPAGLRKKIYIIDEVHMLTTEAFNALLKTLEEPPEHALFILCTTNAEKLPGTIISRCTRIDFKKATTQDLMESLKRVKKGEGREIEKEALEELAARSEGSYRDAHKLLEEILTAFPRAKITLEMVRKVLGENLAENFFDWVFPCDSQKGLKMIGALVEKGVDLKFFLQMILDTLHAHLLKKYGLEDENFSYFEQLNNLTIEQLKLLMSLFSEASQEIKTAVIPQLPLEMAIIEWCEQKKEDAGGDEFSHPALSDDKYSSGALARSQKTSPDVGVSAGLSKIVTRHPPTGEVNIKGVLEKGAPHLPNKNMGEIESHWQEILTAVKPYNHSVAGLLRSCQPDSFDGENLNINVFYKFHFEKLSEPKVRDLLEKVVTEVFGQKIKVYPHLGERRKND